MAAAYPVSNLTALDWNKPDPDGDIILIASAPEEQPQYSQHAVVSSFVEYNATAAIVTVLRESNSVFRSSIPAARTPASLSGPTTASGGSTSLFGSSIPASRTLTSLSGPTTASGGSTSLFGSSTPVSGASFQRFASSIPTSEASSPIYGAFTPVSRASDSTESPTKELSFSLLSTWRYTVSSRHLALASEYFRTRLKECWPEGADLQSKGTAELVITDIEPEPLLILLNIIHGRMSRVPNFVSLTQLTRIAVLVDYFRCYEAVSLVARSWIDRLNQELTKSTTSSDVCKWIFISRVFRVETMFKNAIQFELLRDSGKMNTLGLPIPPELKDAIDKIRIDALESIIAALYARIDDLLDSKTICKYDCDAASLGALMKQMKANELVPRPASPFNHLSVHKVTGALRAFVAPECRSFSTLGCPNKQLIIGRHADAEVTRVLLSLDGFDARKYF